MIHHIPIDGDIDARLKEFNAKLPAGEKIVSFSSNEEYLFIQTETTKRDRNLLLEEYLANENLSRMPPPRR